MNETYATVIGSTGRHGYTVAARTGSVIDHTHIGGGSPEELRERAERLYPNRLIVLPGDPAPWN